MVIGTTQTGEYLKSLVAWEKRLIDEDKSMIRMTELYQIGLIKCAILKAKGNKTEAAKILGCQRTTLLEQIKRYDLEKDCYNAPESPPMIDKLVDSIEYRLREKELETITETELKQSMERVRNLQAALEAEELQRKRELTFNVGFDKAANGD